jgi:carboxylate-amine ligase
MKAPWTDRDRAAALRIAFDRSVLSLTVGVEEELMLIDPASGRLVPGIEEVLRSVAGDERFGAELRASQVELVTRPYLSAADVGRQLAVARLDLAAAIGQDVALLACGAHPAASDPGPITDGERYRAIARANPWAARFMLTCGLHIHVAVADGDRALAVYNALRSFLPELAALSANSPFHSSSETGVGSARLHLNRSLPRHGVPPVFRDWDAYVDLIDWGRAGDAIPDASYHWWDLRLHPGFGTVELRVCDTQTEISHTVALVALAQTLVAWLAQRHDAGERLPVHDGHRIAESIALALQTRGPGSLLCLDTGQRQRTSDRAERLLEQLAPTAAELGTSAELERLLLLGAARGARQQAAVARERGPDGLVDWLARRTLAAPRAFLDEAGVPVEADGALGRVGGIDGAGRSVPPGLVSEEAFTKRL